MPTGRGDRYATRDLPDDYRSRFQRDRDRVLYCSALRRLAGVTQVATPAELHVFHNRLTHTLEVAQIGRRIAEKLTKTTKGKRLARLAGGIDPDVVETACLAHDLGHPPFGHVGEDELDSLAKSAGLGDGFEGNAQSFRIVTRLAIRDPVTLGLNLTAASLNAILKYPWLRETQGHRHEKCGAYHSEEDVFQFARSRSNGQSRPPEAMIMDWADDIAYSVHDLDDFFRAGLIPLDRMASDEREVARFLDAAIERRQSSSVQVEAFGEDALRQTFRKLVTLFPLTERYSGTRVQRAALKYSNSSLITRYIDALSIAENQSPHTARLVIDTAERLEVAILKELTWHYVINNRALATQQHGQRQVISGLFHIYSDEADKKKRWAIFPTGYRERLQEVEDTVPESGRSRERVRIVVDLIASMTEHQAIAMYKRLTGSSLGSMLDTTE